MACRSPQSMLVPSSPSLHSSPFSGHWGADTFSASWVDGDNVGVGVKKQKKTNHDYKEAKRHWEETSKNKPGNGTFCLLFIKILIVVISFYGSRHFVCLNNEHLIRVLARCGRPRAQYNNNYSHIKKQPNDTNLLVAVLNHSLCILEAFFFFLHPKPTGDGDFLRKVACFLLSDARGRLVNF